ncbi:proline dehydrogenase family protein [Natrarchaeobius chitinivorans]|uniref:proline dehydrogenase n=1 Tax=Natrarchaeobius chitinivorans TaxID=1679083 RepID=A0A3N6LTX9_NATCH|nr:proline dehydrogenase family protein [Natrarchaeobius chitinivorans]RQG93623.1 proline dehydrogenase [Natrarchaeobius chitinivorans]
MIPPIANKFVAGETPQEAIDHVQTLNDRDVNGILNLLGEHYEEADPANADADTYLELIDDIEQAGVDSCISVKPSQIGLGVGRDLFERNLSRIAERGDEANVFVWVDMEDHTTTDATLDAYESLVRDYGGNMGICLQANLRRTREDLERLSNAPGKVRIVKGAYSEPDDIAYTKKDRVDAVYRDLIEYMFSEFEDGVAIGSHDPAVIAHAKQLHREHETPYEVQMLMGVRTDAQRDLAADGVEVYQYVPYGSKWFSYFYRRIRERKENLAFALRAIVS